MKNLKTEKRINMKERFNCDRLMRYVKAQQYVFVSVLAVSVVSNIYFAYRWQRAAFREVTYFVTPDATYPAFASRKSSSKSRHKWEVENFAEELIVKMLDHSGDTYDEDLEYALRMMDKESGYKLLKQFIEDDLEALYKQHNGVSNIIVKEVIVDTSRAPFEVLVIYDMQVRFVGMEKKIEPKVTRGAIFLQAIVVPRCKKNPYGLKAVRVTFVEPPKREQRKKP
ncbi:MAG: hypothetical protein AAF335_03855 [Bacteroidota bacterium]